MTNDKASSSKPSTEVPTLSVTESRLAEVWSHILKCQAGELSTDSNFLSLSGRSPSAISRLLTDVSEAFHVMLELKALRGNFALCDMARAIDALLTTKAGQAPRIERVSREGDLPLSYAQQRMWFLYQLNPEADNYHMPAGWRLRGLDEKALQLALTAVLARHEVLRTVLINDEGTPKQRILEPQPWDLPVVDLTHLEGEEQDKEVARRSAEDFRTQFDLEKGPITRAQLLRLSAGEHFLFVTMHHIVTDGWSMAVFWNDLMHFYDAFTSEKPPTLRPLSIQYLDYAVWQRGASETTRLDSQVDYWKDQLTGAPTEVTLPYKGPRPPKATTVGKTLTLTLSRERSQALRSLSQKNGATLYMTLLAAFRTILSRYSGQDDICIGSPIAGRTHAELESLIGFFTNTLVFRNALRIDDSFADLLKREREAALSAYANQEAPFERIIEALDLERDLSRNPLFQVMYVHQNTPKAKKATGLDAQAEGRIADMAKVDLRLGSDDTDGQISFRLTYNTDLFDGWLIAQLLAHFDALLEAVSTNANQPLANIELLSTDQRHIQLASWNDTKSDFGPFAAVHQLFEEQVDKSPDAIALRFEGDSMSYAELDRRANQLARHLVECGVKPDDSVALLLERSFDMQVAIFAVLKAGACYVPLDPHHPTDRMAAGVEDSGARVVVGHSQWKACVDSMSVQTLWLDTITERLADKDPSRLNLAIAPEQLVYTIFTSGSEGRPKGVMTSHQNLRNEILWLQRDIEIGDNDVVLLKTPYAFVASAREIFAPFVAGATLVYAKPYGEKEPAYLANLMQSEGTTIVHFVPSMLEVFLEATTTETWKTVTRVLVGGEAISVGVRDAFFQKASAELINCYGPTETTIAVAEWRCQREAPGVTVPIGRPTANVQFYVLDKAMQIVPVGVVGELYVGGTQVTKGYANQPELTAERFVLNPFGAPASRLYRTGDLVRYRQDGVLEYLGREDGQVQLRGIRIELGEIESILRSHDQVARCAVTTRLVADAEQLVAYVVPREGDIDNVALQAHLGVKLPSYMVPSLFVQLESLPLNASGKLDRRALPAPEQTGIGERIAPTTPTQIALAEIWGSLLNVEEVGITDDFFALGGHSLLAMRVLAQITKRLGATLQVNDVFEAPTIEAMSRLIDTDIQQNKERIAAISDDEVMAMLAAEDDTP